MKKRFLSHLTKRFVRAYKCVSFEEMLYKKGCVTDLGHTLLLLFYFATRIAEQLEKTILTT